MNSNMIINKATASVYLELQQKAEDPVTAYRANIWHPKAIEVQTKTKDIISYLEGLKEQLKNKAGLADSDYSIDNDNKKAVRRLLKKRSTEMYEKLIQYKSALLAIDSNIYTTFSDKIILTRQSFDTLKVKKKDIFQTFFEDVPTIGALTIISQFQTNAKITENRIATFCNNKVSKVDYFTSYSAIIGQSSNAVEAGEMLEITAGVGYFSVKEAKPEIVFGGKKIDLDETGVAVYNFKAPSIPGKYVVPVKINFTGQDGTQQLITKDVEYVVR